MFMNKTPETVVTRYYTGLAEPVRLFQFWPDQKIRLLIIFITMIKGRATSLL